MAENLLGPTCQSCGIPLMRADDFGREANFVIKVDYCRYCYDKGKFHEPDITFDQMVEKVAKFMMSRREMPIDNAKAQAKALLSQLKRWQGQR
ncbi:MAG: zinc ribbon domain-containing protein [Deltaproteobacteria bacterium]|nr:zinc ribbon domain-containing protein [Deltaproteobacteria bacterium]